MSEPHSLAEARAACLRYLARRDYCRNELLEKLRTQGCEESVAREAVEQLSLEGLQSDRRFLENFVWGRVAKGYGEARIRQELRFKGINREDMDEVLRTYDWDGLLVEVYVKKYGHSPPPSIKERAVRLRFLQQKGFAASAIGTLLRHLHHDDP